MKRMMKISGLKLVKEFYPREGVDQERVGEFAELLKEGVKFEPIRVTRDKVVLDGIHRLRAHELAGLEKMEVEVVEDAGKFLLLVAASLNSKHGKPLTNKEKRSVAQRVLAAKPEFNLKKLAKSLSVSERTMRYWTEELRQSQDAGLRQRALELRGPGKENMKTEQKIADELGVPQQTISRWLTQNGKVAEIGKTDAVSSSEADRRNAEGLRAKMGEVMRLHEQGETDEKISEQTKYPVKTVARWIQKSGKVEDDDVRNEWDRVFADANEQADAFLVESLRKILPDIAAERRAIENDPEWQRRNRARGMLTVVVPLLEKYLECPDHGEREEERGRKAVEGLTLGCGLKFSDAVEKWRKEIADASA